ncbi:MAG: CoA-transferase subunit beta [Propionibacteriales bacterium]|nr:CoA-transferase subunit beta [Propionibacteriales bacterium]
MSTSTIDWTADEMMTVASARALAGARTCFVGIGLPSRAANLARLTDNPGLVLIYESGTLGAKPSVLPLSIGDGELADTADSIVSVPEIFNYWLQGGRCDVGFLGAAQVDRFGNLNTTSIARGDGRPDLRLPGAGGAPEIAAHAGKVLIVVRHSDRVFVEKLSFITSVGFGTGTGFRERLGLRGAGPTQVITDLGILEPDPESRELTLVAVHPGVTVDRVREATGWPLKVDGDLATTDAPTERELTTMRELQARTKEVHRART